MGTVLLGNNVGNSTNIDLQLEEAGKAYIDDKTAPTKEKIEDHGKAIAATIAETGLAITSCVAAGAELGANVAADIGCIVFGAAAVSSIYEEGKELWNDLQDLYCDNLGWGCSTTIERTKEQAKALGFFWLQLYEALYWEAQNYKSQAEMPLVVQTTYKTMSQLGNEASEHKMFQGKIKSWWSNPAKSAKTGMYSKDLTPALMMKISEYLGKKNNWLITKRSDLMDGYKDMLPRVVQRKILTNAMKQEVSGNNVIVGEGNEIKIKTSCSPVGWSDRKIGKLIRKQYCLPNGSSILMDKDYNVVGMYGEKMTQSQIDLIVKQAMEKAGLKKKGDIASSSGFLLMTGLLAVGGLVAYKVLRRK